MNAYFTCTICVLIMGILFFYLRPEFISMFDAENKTEVIYFNSIPFKWRNKVIVDVGCGSGKLLDYFHREKLIDTFYGIDLEEMIHITKEEYPQYEKYFKIGVGENIPFNDSSVDVLIFQYSFHHVEDFEKALLEISRVLKKGGRVVFLEPVIIRGRYEVDELIKFFVPDLERPLRDKAYKYISEGNKDLGIEVEDFERFFIFKKDVETFSEGMKHHRPEAWKENEDEMNKYVRKLTEEDGVKEEDIRFFETTRVNIWKLV